MQSTLVTAKQNLNPKSRQKKSDGSETTNSSGSVNLQVQAWMSGGNNDKRPTLKQFLSSQQKNSLSGLNC